MGECINVSEIGDLSKWIPNEGGDFDIIAVALQETKISTEMLQAIHAHLGELFGMSCLIQAYVIISMTTYSSCYTFVHVCVVRYSTCHTGVDDFTAFRASIGEALVFFGKIELFVFVRTFHIEQGSVRPLNDAVKCVKTGINLFVDRAPNKGLCHAFFLHYSD